MQVAAESDYLGIAGKDIAQFLGGPVIPHPGVGVLQDGAVAGTVDHGMGEEKDVLARIFFRYFLEAGLQPLQDGRVIGNGAGMVRGEAQDVVLPYYAVPAFQGIPHDQIQVRLEIVLSQDGMEDGMLGHSFIGPAVLGIHVVVADGIHQGDLCRVQDLFIDFLEGNQLGRRCGVNQVSHHQHAVQLSSGSGHQLLQGRLKLGLRAIPVSYVCVADNAQGQDNGIIVKTAGLRPAGEKKGKGQKPHGKTDPFHRDKYSEKSPLLFIFEV